MVTKIGLDLGYANITLSNVSADVYREPSVVLLDKNTRRVLSVGNSAALGQNSVDSLIVRPFKNGLLYSSDLTRDIIKHAVNSLGVSDKIRCMIALPSDLNTKQENEVIKMLSDAGVSEAFCVNPALAALIGAGYSPDISAISINIGAAYTEIMVIHKGNVIRTSHLLVGGENFDKAVKDYIYEQGDMTVSLLVARTIKERLGAVWQGRPSESIDIEGTLSLTGNRVRMSISTEDVVGVFEKPLSELLMVIANVIKDIPTECVEDIFENGIIITGGGAEMYGLDIMMSKVLGIAVTKPAVPIDSVSKGLARINAFLPARVKSGTKNLTNNLAKIYRDKSKK